MRKITQITSYASKTPLIQDGKRKHEGYEWGIVALCDDGTLWDYTTNITTKKQQWNLIPEIPQSKIKPGGNDEPPDN